MRFCAPPLCLFPIVFRFPRTAWPWVTFKRSFLWSTAPLVFQTIMWLWQGAWQASHVCVTTSQLLLGDITTDNLPWIFIRHCCWHTHTHVCTHTQMIITYNNAPLIKESSLSPGRAAEFCWNKNQSVEAFRVRSSFCLSQHTVSFGWQHFNQGTFDSLPLTKCWFKSLFRESPLIALTINEKVRLIYL